MKTHKLKKLLIAPLALILAATSLTGCFGSDESSQAPFDPDAGDFGGGGNPDVPPVPGGGQDSSTSTSEDKPANPDADKSHIVTLQNLEYSLVLLDEDNNEIGEPSLSTTLSFGNKYAMGFKFDVSSNYDNSLLSDKFTGTLSIEEQSINVVDAAWKEVTTSDTDYWNKVNGSGGSNTTFEAKFTAPSSSEKVATFIFQLILTPTSVGDATIKFGFSATEMVLAGVAKSGVTKAIKIVPMKLDAPVLRYDSDMLELRWINVRKAHHYIFYKDGELIKLNGETVQFVVDAFTGVGSEIGMSLVKLGISESCRVKIQAIGNGAGINPSNYSNEITIVL